MPASSVPSSFLARIGWFVGLWAGGVLALAIVATLIKIVIFHQW
ncbi:DUF2474 family protein [Asaia lannensis]|uniref:DUF2474 family protein n=1 Tax=Asaia lannensis NBRC 102526 TaxID=1307926 RepID=A0ABT1CJN8_9PROT|nr:DUF2474 family protein [Asaia lannensis]MCO6160434.1 DUF2474 family protein [Asaia lannensis NBRC 102526]